MNIPDTWKDEKACRNEFMLWYAFYYNALDYYGAFRRGFRAGAFEATMNMYHCFMGPERAPDISDAPGRGMLTDKQVIALDNLAKVAALLDGAEDAAMDEFSNPDAVIMYACKEGVRRLNEIMMQMNR